jgi:hypothetical protein
MNIFPLFAVLPTLIIAGLATVSMSQRSMLAAHRLSLWAAGIAAVLGAAVVAGAAALAAGHVNLWGISTPAYSLPEPLRLPFLTILLLGLAIATVTDLRERALLAPVVIVPVVGAMFIAAIAIPLNRDGSLLHVSIGLIIVAAGGLVCGGFTYLLSLGGRLFSHLRGGGAPDYALLEAMEEQSDLRFSDFIIPFVAVGLVAASSGLAWASNAPVSLIGVVLVAIMAVPFVQEPRRLSDRAFWPHLGGGADESKLEEAKTGQDAPATEDFGTGDVWLMVLVGVLLGPIYGLAAMFIGMFFNGLLTALPLVVYDIVTHREADRHTPLVPWLAVGTLVVLFYAGLR